MKKGAQQAGASWTFLSNHAHVMLSLALDPNARIRDIAALVGLTERAVQRILGELVADGVVESTRHGRRNSYRINKDVPLRHPLESHRTVQDLIRLVRAGRGGRHGAANSRPVSVPRNGTP